MSLAPSLLAVALLLVGVPVRAQEHEEEAALVTEKVFLDIEVEGHTERVVIGLFGTTSPKTVRNFVGLANHEVRPSFL